MISLVDLKEAFSDFTIVLAVVNPALVALRFMSVTQHDSLGERRRVARRASLISALILVGAILIGQPLLAALGISLPAFRIAGGLILLLTGISMLFKEPEAAPAEASVKRDVAVFPLAMPAIAGPGAITAVVLVADNNILSVPHQITGTAFMLIVIAICYVAMLCGGALQRILGPTGTNVLTRLMGLLLTALAAETMIIGIKQTFGLS